MSYTSFVARRYFRSRQNDGFLSFITTISIFGVALGSASLIIALSVLGGFEREITQKVMGFTSQIQIQGFQNLPLPNYETNTIRIEDSVALVRTAAPFVGREALIRSKHSVDGIFLKGLDPVRNLSPAGRYIVDGKYDIDRKMGDPPKIVLGRRLAARLSLKIGDRATVFALGDPAEGGRVRARQFTVTGMYESGMAEYDDVYAFTSLSDAQIVFELGNAVTGYDINVSDLDSIGVVKERIEELLGYPHFGRTVFQNYRNLFTWIELQKKPVPIILGMIIIVATVNIIGTLLMMVLDRMREIGVLRAMGSTRGAIARIFLRQAFAIALIGTVIGNLIAFGLCFAQAELKILSLPSDIYFMSSVPILLRWEYFAIVSAISLILCLLSSLLPARLAARIDPVSAIRMG